MHASVNMGCQGKSGPGKIYEVILVEELRTVPTKYKGFCVRLGPCGKSRSLQGLLESTKKNRGSHAFFRDN